MAYFSWSNTVSTGSPIKVGLLTEIKNNANTVISQHCPSHNGTHDAVHNATINTSNHSYSTCGNCNHCTSNNGHDSSVRGSNLGKVKSSGYRCSIG